MALVLTLTAFALLLARVVRARRGTWRYILAAAGLVLAASQLLPRGHALREDVAASSQTLFWVALALLPVLLYVLVLRRLRRRTGVDRRTAPAPHPTGLVQIAEDAALLGETHAALGRDRSAAIGASEALSLAWRAPDGALAGHARMHSLGGIAELEALWVTPACRRQGIGRQLLAAAEDEARRRGAGRAVATVDSWQAPAFFAEAGYRPMAQRQIGAGHVRAWLEKDLT